MKRIALNCGTTLLIFVVFVGTCILWLRARWTNGIQENACAANVKQIALGMLVYSQDYDDKLPPAIFHDKTAGWANGLQPYLKSYGIFQCPLETHPSQKTPQPKQPGFTDYWMNANVSGMEIKEVRFPNDVILLGDGDGGAPESTASYAISGIPVLWRNLTNSPPQRHHGGAHYAFMDGHDKWLKPEQLTQDKPSKNKSIYTFRVK